MELSCPLRTTLCIPQEKFPRKPYNKSFIDQAGAVKMAGYWPRSFLRVHKHAKKENLANIQAILTPHLVNNLYRVLIEIYNDKYVLARNY